MSDRDVLKETRIITDCKAGHFWVDVEVPPVTLIERLFFGRHEVHCAICGFDRGHPPATRERGIDGALAGTG